jgi:hypothetical protein
LQLEQELVESNSLRKQQITELGILREDEHKKLQRMNEKEIETININHDNEVSQLKKQINSFLKQLVLNQIGSLRFMSKK